MVNQPTNQYQGKTAEGEEDVEMKDVADDASVFASGSGKSAKADKATGLGEMKLTKGDKKSAFTAFSPAEKQMYRKNIGSLGCSDDPAEDPGARPVTAIDDFMQSMTFAETFVMETHLGMECFVVIMQYNTLNMCLLAVYITYLSFG